MVSTVATTDDGVFDAAEAYAIHRQRFSAQRSNVIVNQIRWAWSLASEGRSGMDVLHCGNIRPTGYAVLMARLRVRFPYVLYVYGGDLLKERTKARNAAKRAMARRLFSEASGVVAISAWSAELAVDLMQRLGVVAPPEVRSIPLGTDPVHFSPARATGRLRTRWSLGDGPVMLTAARLVPHKGQDTGIRVLARLTSAFPSLRYAVVGEGPYRNDLARLARDLGVADRVIFAGTVSDNELADAYGTATVYLGASRVESDLDAEGFGIAFVEAAASGLPVVAGDSGGVRSAVRDGETGFVVPPTDVEAIAAAVRSLITDEELRRRVGACGRDAVERYYNWDRVARETIAFVRDVATRAPATRGR